MVDELDRRRIERKRWILLWRKESLLKAVLERTVPLDRPEIGVVVVLNLQPANMGLHLVQLLLRLARNAEEVPQADVEPVGFCRLDRVLVYRYRPRNTQNFPLTRDETANIEPYPCHTYAREVAQNRRIFGHDTRVERHEKWNATDQPGPLGRHSPEPVQRSDKPIVDSEDPDAARPVRTAQTIHLVYEFLRALQTRRTALTLSGNGVALQASESTAQQVRVVAGGT